MVDIESLKAAGYSQERLKSLFTAEPKAVKIKKFIEINSSRITKGIERCLDNARFWWGIDEAYDAPQRQISYTMLKGLINRKMDSEELLSLVNDWGLGDMMTPMLNKDGTGCIDKVTGHPAYKLDVPVFFNIFVPLMAAYVKIRWGKLFTDRDLYPLYRYSPLKLTTKESLRCELITSRIQRQATEMNNREDEKQSIFQMLLYGLCLNFPMEPWYREQQVFDGKPTTVREGVRWAIPHPSRVFYDQAYRLSTINSDTGVQWCGYWDICRYSDLRDNEKYWNRDKIKWGRYQWPYGNGYSIYSKLYPCYAKFPSLQGRSSPSDGVGQLDRLTSAFAYTEQEQDAAVSLVPWFVKLTPSEWDLFDYDYPVWFRFLFCGDDTVIHAEPYAYSPAVAYLYDYDANRARNSSLGLELVPHQDLISNYLTQLLLTVKKNLSSLTFYNTDQLREPQIRMIENLGQTIYTTNILLPWSKTEAGWAQGIPGGGTVGDAFQSVKFPQGNIAEISQAINMMISMTERVLGYSPYEVGQAATHEQSATEANIVQSNVGIRLQFTDTGIESAFQARKQALYDAMVAYSDDEVFAEVADLNDQKRDALEKMGFKVEEGSTSETKAGVRGDKKALRLTSFVSDREGVKRVQDAKVAATMIQTFQAIFSNQAIVMAVGVKQLIDLFNQVLYYVGVPSDFRLRIDEKAMKALEKAQGGTPDDQAKGMAIIAKQIVEAQLGEMAKGLKEKVIEPIQGQMQQITQGVQQVGEAMAQVAQRLDQNDKNDVQQEQAIAMLTQNLQQIVQALSGQTPQPPVPGGPPPEVPRGTIPPEAMMGPPPMAPGAPPGPPPPEMMAPPGPMPPSGPPV